MCKCDECLFRGSKSVVMFENIEDNIMALCEECITTFSQKDYKVIKCTKCLTFPSSYMFLEIGNKFFAQFECDTCKHQWRIEINQ